MTEPNGLNEKALRKAESLQETVDQLLQATRDTERLMEKLEHLAHDLYELAKAWEPVNPQKAAEVHKQESQIRALCGELERLGEYEADEAQRVIKDVMSALRGGVS